MVEIKFCGMTRAEDARQAAAAGARYVGVVFAGGPRRQDVSSASGIFAGLPAEIERVGVFGREPPEAVAAVARSVGLAVVQLHGDPTAEEVEALRDSWGGAVWAALRVSGTELPERSRELFGVADAVVVDAKVDGALGGTGVALAWEPLAAPLAALRSTGLAKLVLAGGLGPENVARAVTTLHPDVVDVSSGIESRVGRKDPARMRAFRDAVRSVEGAR